MEATKQYVAEGTETGKAFWIVDTLHSKTVGLLDKTSRESINLIIDALNRQSAFEQAKGGGGDMNPFGDELRALLNGYSKENESNTPDHVLVQYIERCLDAFDEATRARDRWYGVSLRPGHHIVDHERDQ